MFKGVKGRQSEVGHFRWACSRRAYVQIIAYHTFPILLKSPIEIAKGAYRC